MFLTYHTVPKTYLAVKDRELVSDPTNRSARNGQNTKSFNMARLLTTAHATSIATVAQILKRATTTRRPLKTTAHVWRTTIVECAEVTTAPVVVAPIHWPAIMILQPFWMTAHAFWAERTLRSRC